VFVEYTVGYWDNIPNFILGLKKESIFLRWHKIQLIPYLVNIPKLTSKNHESSRIG
jgi:hypothetical protein